MFRLPVEQSAGAAGIANHDGNIGGALSRGILLDGNLDATSRYQAREDIRYSARYTGRDVEHGARLQTFQVSHDQRVGVGNVSYIEEIPLCIKIADGNDRRRE